MCSKNDRVPSKLTVNYYTRLHNLILLSMMSSRSWIVAASSTSLLSLSEYVGRGNLRWPDEVARIGRLGWKLKKKRKWHFISRCEVTYTVMVLSLQCVMPNGSTIMMTCSWKCCVFWHFDWYLPKPCFVLTANCTIQSVLWEAQSHLNNSIWKKIVKRYTRLCSLYTVDTVTMGNKHMVRLQGWFWGFWFILCWWSCVPDQNTTITCSRH